MEPLIHAKTNIEVRESEAHVEADMDKQNNIGKLNSVRLIILYISTLSVVSWCRLPQFYIEVIFKISHNFNDMQKNEVALPSQILKIL